MDKELDIIATLKTIFFKKKVIFKWGLVFFFIGLIFAIFNRKEFTASSTILPLTESNKSIGGNLSGLAAIAGINLGANGEDSNISPVLYPQIIGGLPFQRKLLETKLTIIGESEKFSFKDYYTNIYKPSIFYYMKKYTIGLPSMAIKYFSKSSLSLYSSDEILSVSEEEFYLLKKIVNQMSVNSSAKEGFIRISFKMPESIAAAEMTKSVEELLQKYIINYKSQKSNEQLKFIHERYLEKENEFKKLQNELALFRDQNHDISSSLAKTKLEQIQAQYDLVYGVYSELAKQLEKQKIQVKQITPIFTILKPVTIPIYKSNTSRIIILLTWTVFGIFLGVINVLLKIVFEKLLLKWNS